MAKYKVNKKTKKTFEIQSVFMDSFISGAQPVFSLVYIYAMRLCQEAPENITHKTIAEHLGILESDVINAWRYWESRGAVILNNRTSEAEFDVEFCDLPEAAPPAVLAKKDSAPVYSPIEIAMYIKQDKKVKELFDFTQEKLSKPLNSSDLSILYSFYDYYHLPFEVIFMMIEHFKDKRNIRYMEKVVISWCEKGITTPDKVEAFLKESAAPKASAGKNKFVNFEQREVDYDKLSQNILNKRMKT